MIAYKTTTHKEKCPFCGGTGVFIKKGYSEKQRNKARRLYGKGETLRNIADKLGITGSGKAQKVLSMINSKL